MKLNKNLVSKAEDLGVNIKDNSGDLGELVKLLPSNYLFIEQKLWCGNISVDADGYDYGNATVEMLIKLKQNELFNQRIGS